MQAQSEDSVATHSPRGRELLLGLLLVLLPVVLLFPVKAVLVYAPSKHWTDAIEGTFYLLDVIFDLWGLRRLLNSLSKKIDPITVCAVSGSILALLFLGLEVKWLAYLIKYL